jgi:hypothetical protein
MTSITNTADTATSATPRTEFADRALNEIAGAAYHGAEERRTMHQTSNDFASGTTHYLIPDSGDEETLCHDDARDIANTYIEEVGVGVLVGIEGGPDGWDVEIHDGLAAEELTDGWSVTSGSSRWWPDAETAEAINADADPSEAALHACRGPRECGEWSS